MTAIEVDTTYDEFVKMTDDEKTKLIVNQVETQLKLEKEAAEVAAVAKAKRLEYETAAKALEAEYQAKRKELDAQFI